LESVHLVQNLLDTRLQKPSQIRQILSVLSSTLSSPTGPVSAQPGLGVRWRQPGKIHYLNGRRGNDNGIAPEFGNIDDHDTASCRVLLYLSCRLAKQESFMAWNGSDLFDVSIQIQCGLATAL
jgi:hypothetical protein